MLDGRVKTLHPRVHGGILARRDLASASRGARRARHPDDRPRRRQSLPVPRDRREARRNARRRDREHRHRRSGDGARRRRRTGRTSASSSTPTTIRDCSTSSQANGGALPDATRFALAQKAFAHTAAYDGAIANWLTARGPDGVERGLPTSFRYAGELVQPLRYGENPHQQAAFYRDEVAAAGHRSRRTGSCRARSCRTTTSPTATPRGNASSAFDGAGLRDRQAREPVRRGDCRDAARGLSQGVRRPIPRRRSAASSRSTGRSTRDVVEAIAAQFLEVLIAPAYTPEALAVIDRKTNVRVLEIPGPASAETGSALDFKRVGGGLLVQTADDRDDAAPPTCKS